jgi:hypothetical protein
MGGEAMDVGPWLSIGGGVDRDSLRRIRQKHAEPRQNICDWDKQLDAAMNTVRSDMKTRWRRPRHAFYRSSMGGTISGMFPHSNMGISNAARAAVGISNR